MLFFKVPAGPLQTNAILLGCPRTKKGAVIDSSPGSTPFLLKQAQKSELSIEKILLTHSHWDHIADLSILKEKTKAPVFVHPLDAKNVESPGADGLSFSIEIAPVKVDYFLTEGEKIEVGDLVLEVIHCPGHSPGSVSFYLRKEEIVFTGDTLFCGCFGRIDLPTAEPLKMRPSLEKLSCLPKQTRVVPGHGPDTTIEKEGWLCR